MKKSIKLAASAAAAVALAVVPAVPALAQTESGWSYCGSSWSYTWANSTASLRHTHDNGTYWESATKAPGVSSHRGIWKPGSVFLSLSTSGNYSGAVFGCAA